MTTCPVLVLRPEPGNTATVAAAEALGLTAIPAAISRVEPVVWTAPATDRFDALLLGSANVVHHGGEGLARLARLPVYAVGEATAAAARGAGFMVAACGSGGIEELLPRLATDGRTDVLRPAGAEHVAIEPPKGMRVVTVVVYAARPLSLPIQAVETLRHRAVVLLHSAVAAERFAEQCDAQEIDRSEVSLACLGQRIADAAGQAWREIAIAPRPEDAALLALAARMCQSGAVRVDANNTIG